MPLSKGDKLQRLTQRSVPGGRQPIEPLTLEPLPNDILKAFPAMALWHQRNNARIAEFVSKMNTVVPT